MRVVQDMRCRGQHAAVLAGATAQDREYGGCSATIFDGQIHLVTRGAVLEHSEGAWAEVADRPGDTRTLDHACASLLLG